MAALPPTTDDNDLQHSALVKITDADDDAILETACFEIAAGEMSELIPTVLDPRWPANVSNAIMKKFDYNHP